ncbi:MAG: cytochrome b [Paracoccaceae bacterium]|nr:cytochrome b [Paracoccaceae bacterium]
MGNSDQGWGWPARLIHWLMAALILFQLGLGVRMVRIVTDVYEKFELYQTHKSWGFVIFSLALVRVLWRALNRVPEPPDAATRIERLMARGAHLALYVLMVAMPVTGWLLASASPLQDSYGLKNMVFTWFELPDPFQPGSKELNDLFASIHAWSAFAMTVILAGHAGAALRHHFVKRDGVLRRMMIGR